MNNYLCPIPLQLVTAHATQILLPSKRSIGALDYRINHFIRQSHLTPIQ